MPEFKEPESIGDLGGAESGVPAEDARISVKEEEGSIEK